MNVDSSLGITPYQYGSQGVQNGQEVGSQDQQSNIAAQGGQAAQDAARNNEQAQQEAAQTTGVGSNINFTA